MGIKRRQRTQQRSFSIRRKQRTKSRLTGMRPSLQLHVRQAKSLTKNQRNSNPSSIEVATHKTKLGCHSRYPEERTDSLSGTSDKHIGVPLSESLHTSTTVG